MQTLVFLVYFDLFPKTSDENRTFLRILDFEKNVGRVFLRSRPRYPSIESPIPTRGGLIRNQIPFAVELRCVSFFESLVLGVMAILAQKDQVLRIECDIRIRDVFRSDMDDVMDVNPDSTALLASSVCGHDLLQPCLFPSLAAIKAVHGFAFAKHQTNPHSANFSNPPTDLIYSLAMQTISP